MAIAPFVYMPLPSLGMNSHLMDYGGGYNRISLYQRTSHEAFDQMQGFYGDQDTGRVKGRNGVGNTMFRVKQGQPQSLGGKYPSDPQQGPSGIGGNFPNEHALTKYHQAGKMFALGKHREKDLVNREKEFIAMVLFQNGENERAAGYTVPPQHHRLTDASETNEGGKMNGTGKAGEEAYDLSRRTSTSTVGSTGSSPGSLSPPSPLSRTSLMPSPAGIPMSHSPLPFMSAPGMPLSPMSSLLLSPGSPGMPPSPLPPYHTQTPQPGNGLYYYPRGHHHPMHHSIYNGRNHQHGGKHMQVHVSRNQSFPPKKT